MGLIADPVSEETQEDIKRHNCFVQYLRDLERPVEFVERLNTWQVRLNRNTGRWAISVPVAFMQLLNSAQFASLKQVDRDEAGHRYFRIVSDLEADDCEEGKLTAGKSKKLRTPAQAAKQPAHYEVNATRTSDICAAIPV